MFFILLLMLKYFIFLLNENKQQQKDWPVISLIHLLMMLRKDQQMKGGYEIQKYVNARGSSKQGFKNTNKQTQDSKVTNKLEACPAVTACIITT